MGAAIGSLFIDMALNTAAFASDLGKSNAALQSWASKSNRVLGSVVNGYRGLNKELTSFVSNAFSVRNVMATLVGAGGLGLLVTRSIEAASAIVDVADNIGITTKALQEYQYVAKLSNVATDQLNGALEKFAVNVGKARAGTGPLAEFLKQTNPELLKQVQNSKSLDQALNATFQTMGKYANQQDRLALTSAAFGKANLNMVNLVKDGADAFDLARQRANELGIVIDDQLLRNAEAAGDKIDTLAMVLRAQLITAVAQNATEIGNLADSLVKLTPKIIALAQAVVDVVSVFVNWEESLLSLQAIFEVFQTAMAVGLVQLGGQVVAWVKGIMAGFGQVRTIVESFASDMGNMIMHPFDNNGFATLNAELDKGFTGAFMEVYQDSLNQTDEFTKKLTEKMDENLVDLGNRIRALKERSAQGAAAANSPGIGGAGIEGYAEQMRAAAAAAEKAAAAHKKLEAEAKRVFDETRTPIEQYNIKMDELNKMLDAGVISWETYGRAVEKAKGELTKAQREGTLFADIMDKAIDGNIKSWKDLGKAVLDYGKQLLKTLANGGQLPSGGLGAGGMGMGNIFSGIGSFFGVGQLPWQTSPASSLFSSIGSFLGFHSGGVVGGSYGSTRMAHAGLFANAPRFHGGGIVGDEVPIIAKRGERVLTEQQQKNMGMGGTVVYNIDARGSDAGVEQRLMNMMRELSASIEPRSVKAVKAARFRNPSLFGENQK